VLLLNREYFSIEKKEFHARFFLSGWGRGGGVDSTPPKTIDQPYLVVKGFDKNI
jgi:hypothetical protein